MMAALPATAQNADLVTNGDFEAGNTGFSSTYHYNGNADSNANPASLYTPPGAYYVQTGGDHTTGAGTWIDFDTANAATDDDYYWSETFNVVANSDYALSYWVRSVNGGNAPAPFARVNNQLVQGPVGVGSGDWTQLTATWNSGAATTATLTLGNADHQYSYNDLGVDDISFTGPAAAGADPGAVPEPATWAMMIMGAGAIGSTMRRRKLNTRVSLA